MTTLSVALCTCDGSRYLPDLLQSLEHQTRPPDEVIICDDASRDDTGQLLEVWQAAAPFQVTIKRNERRLGVAANFSQAAELCSGSIVAFCDQDDVWALGKLSSIADALGDRPDAQAVIHDAELLDASGLRTGQRLWPMLGFDVDEQHAFTIGQGLTVLLRHNVVTGATLAVRAGLLSLAVPFSTEGLHDVWLGLLATSLGPVAIVPNPLIGYRQHGANQVGAPMASPSARLARRRSLRNVSIREARLLDELLSRLEATGLSSDDPRLRLVENKGRHLRVRSELTGSRVQRVPAVVGEVVSGRYHRFGRGWQSAAYDLLFRTDDPAQP